MRRVVLVVSLAAACRFDHAGLPGERPGDATPPGSVDAAGDAAAPDAPPPDAAPPDAPPDAAPDAAVCPPGYLLTPYGCWRVHDETKTFAAAEDVCASAGGHLVVIDAAEENGFLEGFVADRSLWIGYTDHAVEDSFRWVTDAGEGYENWASGEPNNSWFSEDCVHVLADGTWNDTSCDDSRPFLCEVDGLAQGTMYW